MLKYKIKLNDSNIKKDEFEWSEKYLAPDLSFVSGVTDTSYNLGSYENLASSNSIINSESILSVDAHNVTREGYIVASGKTYPIYSGSTIDYSLEESGDTIDFKYLYINDKYFYYKELEEGISGFSINNLTVYNDGEIVNGIEVSGSSISDDSVKIDTVYWIEDGKVVIDGEEYVFDKNEEGGILKFGEDGIALEASEITECDSLDMHPYSSTSLYNEVTKFKLEKSKDVSEPFESISFSKHYFYIKYKNHYCPIKKVIEGDGYKFVCEIPAYVLSGDTDSLEPIYKDVYYIYDSGENSLQDLYRTAKDAGEEWKLNSANYSGHGVNLLEELDTVMAFVYIEEDEVCLTVYREVINANSGHDIAIHLKNIYSPLKVSEIIELVDMSSDTHESTVYNSKQYGGEDYEAFIVYDGIKYLVEKEICDKAEINGVEYDIDYINGKEDGDVCLVLIGDEEVPMKLSGTTSENMKLVRYGLIVSGDSSSFASDGIYDINTYDGIVIDGVKYPIYPSGVTEDTSASEELYADISLQNRYPFLITEKIGNSLYICEPLMDSTYFTANFARHLSEEICEDVVSNQNFFDIRVKNKIFGEESITETLPFRVTSTPTSSDDYYDLFNDLKININKAYISIPIMFSANAGTNLLKDDLVAREFFEVEKKKAINPIVDMEKDIYVPKKMVSEKYSGSDTVFDEINEIRLNFHFRTRNLDNWKVNDGNNDIVALSGDTDNWFVTDFYPYRKILEDSRDASGDTLQKTSDLMGLLYFTNDDVYYQRSKVAKSFARLSFYDSTDPQTQSLLATSCVFMDEHSLFKKFMDNSRKNVYDYGFVTAPEFSASTNRYEDITELRKGNKINVLTEYIGTKGEKDYSAVTDSTNVVIDEGHRIGSRLTIKNKYDTDSSSEGFYIYMFKEYAENLHPKPIYMKVEFNHAGIGKQIPFVIPMKWSGDTEHIEDKNYNKMYPISALTLSSSDDVKTLKEGFPLSYSYAQSYIPLYAVYDFKKKEYGYVFDSRYVSVDDDNTVNLNLFEMKIKSEETVSDDEKEKKDIAFNRQERAIININDNQFDITDFNYYTE